MFLAVVNPGSIFVQLTTSKDAKFPGSDGLFK